MEGKIVITIEPTDDLTKNSKHLYQYFDYGKLKGNSKVSVVVK